VGRFLLDGLVILDLVAALLGDHGVARKAKLPELQAFQVPVGGVRERK
jgi:hypothetical protein